MVGEEGTETVRASRREAPLGRGKADEDGGSCSEFDDVENRACCPWRLVLPAPWQPVCTRYLVALLGGPAGCGATDFVVLEDLC